MACSSLCVTGLKQHRAWVHLALPDLICCVSTHPDFDRSRFPSHFLFIDLFKTFSIIPG
jgi:hypothetical protein